MTRAPTAAVVVADDDPQFLRLMEHHLRGWSYRVDCARDKGQLLRRLAGPRPDLLLLDVRFGEHDGVELLAQVLSAHPGLRVAMLTAYGSIDNAITAIKLGAIDYLTKPVDLNRLRRVVAHAIDLPAASPPAGPRTVVEPGVGPAPLTRPILGGSPAVRALLDLVARVAAADATVLILGESGTGKELVARAVHEQSPRRDGPFVALNMAALPRELVESTLFGHARGAFTGADQAQRGCCEAADGGTLFLDEVGEMEVGLQAKLLRFLQERSFHRVGQSTPVGVDVRVVAATNRDPADLVRRGLLREDLFYRLSVVPVVLPPLRDRREDVPLLARHFLRRACQRCGRDPLELTTDAAAELARHDWPGNVRELENLAERLAVLGRGPFVGPDDIAAELARGGVTGTGGHPSGPTPPAPPAGVTPLREIDRVEKAALVSALDASQGNVREAARALGLGPATVYRKVKKYEIPLR